ncbi:ScyD/ScyE family protein [Kibdelosporangium philippinense]|uniref:ScyD/ScyE family protein n=1 Tax=Kibdelosporangium philippinense TaxID=211113 RepID=A0ABS8ZGD7_9PSEU|nr:ScyD/ScyE family protein [Kibdelosporangium philippinense]MCE7006885.1 ScyD/ScyE family protein [Kibdelosporangium philippinense]
MNRTIVVLAAGMIAAALVPGVANAGGAKVTTIATGLDNPRGLTFSLDGDLYVAESGKGGTDGCFAGPEGEACLGSSGAVTKIAKGKQKRILTGLPSVAAPAGTNALGPTDVAVKGGSLAITVGLGSDPAQRGKLPEAAKGLATLRTDGYRGLKTIADLGEYEATANPDGGLPDSNPTSLVVSPWGYTAADAGGNSLVGVGPGGHLFTVATFANHDGAQAVPTSVAQGPDGAFYVGELTGVPFKPGSAKVYKVWPGKEPKVFADGFTNIIDVAFDQRGNLYVLEIAKDGLASGGPPVGALIKVNKDGSHETVLDTGLTAPGGLTIKDNAAYISNCGTCQGEGSVVKVALKK